MIRLFNTIIVGFFLLGCAATQIPAKYTPYLQNSTQAILVTAKKDSTQGTLTFYERKNTETEWKAQYRFKVRIGRNGFAWDSSFSQHSDNIKKEGDGCAPAGVFSLGPVFSYYPLPNLKMPFEQVTKKHLCIDDTASEFYNRLVLTDTIFNADWRSFEFMQRNDAQYAYGVWVNYNTNPTVAGNGSCIFLHVWKDADTPTAGCTAMQQEDMLKLIYALDSVQNPMLLQYIVE
ncbi:MAG: L,D-transpeptidase [Chitinophagales bacterium]